MLSPGNGPADIDKAWRVLRRRQILSRSYSARTNGKAERFVQTLCKRWADAMTFPNSEEENRWLCRYLAIENRLRKRSGLSWRSRQQRLTELLGGRTW